jgi:hypothetical protein
MRHGMRSSRRVRVGLGGFALTAFVASGVLAACGSSTPARVPPEQAVTTAVQAIGSQPGVNLQLSLGVTARQLQQMAQGKGGSSDLTLQEAKALSSSSIVVDLNTGNGKPLNSLQTGTNQSDRLGQSDKSGQVGLALQVGATDPVELRYVDQTLYLQANVAALLSDFGQDPSRAASFQQALQAANAYVPGIAALGQGQWVSVSASALSELLQGIASKMPGTTPTTLPSPAKSQETLRELEKAFNSNATYADAGTQGGRNHYRVTLQVHNFVQQVAADLPSDLGNVAGGSSLKQMVSKIPANQTAVVDVWVRDGRVQEFDLDINQFAHEFTFAVPLRIAVGSGTTVTAPAGATSLNLSKISGLLGGMLGSRLNGNSSI